MNEYSLSKYKSSIYLEEFSAKEIEIIPYQEAGLYRFENGKKTKIEDRNRGFTMAELDQMRHRGIAEIYLHEDTEHAYCEIGPEDRRIGVRLQTEQGHIKEGIIDIAKEILAQIVEMDAVARNKSNDPIEDYEEELAYIDIRLNEVELHYFATTVNTEWGAYFKKEATGKWHYEGLD